MKCTVLCGFVVNEEKSVDELDSARKGDGGTDRKTESTRVECQTHIKHMLNV